MIDNKFFQSLIFCVVILGLFQVSAFGQYTASIIESEYTQFELISVAGDQVVGIYRQCTSDDCGTGDVESRGSLITNDLQIFNDITALETEWAIVSDTDGEYQVGYDASCFFGGDYCDHWAALWKGTSESIIYLHPDGHESSYAHGVSDGQQVGYATFCEFKDEGDCYGLRAHAFLWSGSNQNMVNLNPEGYEFSYALDTDQGRQVGYGLTCGSSQDEECIEYARDHALLWSGTPESVIDLDSEKVYSSRAVGISGNQQVGYGQICPDFISDCEEVVKHALLWTGTADSVVDLNPEGYSASSALDVKDGYQVGYADIYPYGDSWYVEDEKIRHAMVWQGTSESAIDLHDSLPEKYNQSIAYGVNADGLIVGTAWADEYGSIKVGVVWERKPNAYGSLDITRLKIKAGKIRGEKPDSFYLSAYIEDDLLDIISDSSNDLKDIEITITSAYDEQVYGHVDLLERDLVKINSSRSKVSYKYKSSKNNPDQINRLSVNLKTGRLNLSSSKINLSGFRSPILFEIRLGGVMCVGVAGESETDYLASGISYKNSSDVINGRKPLPITLMMGISNVLRVDKCSLKLGTKKPSTDSISISGGIAAKFPDIPMTTEDVVIQWNDNSFILPAEHMVQSGTKRIYKYKKPKGIISPVSSAQFDLEKGKFKIKIKNTSVGQPDGEVLFGIQYNAFDESVVLPMTQKKSTYYKYP